MADHSPEELDLAGQPGREPEGAGSGASQRESRTTLRQRTMVRTHRPDPGSGINPAPSRSAPKAGFRPPIRLPSPFPVPFSALASAGNHVEGIVFNSGLGKVAGVGRNGGLGSEDRAADHGGDTDGTG